MKLPLLLLHSIHDEKNDNWALLLPSVRRMVTLSAFVAACMLCHPQYQLTSLALAKRKLYLLQMQSVGFLSHRQRLRICTSSGAVAFLSFRLTFFPHNIRALKNHQEAKNVRRRVGGLQLMVSLALEDLFAFDCSDKAYDGDCSSESSLTGSDVSFSSSFASSDGLRSPSSWKGTLFNSCTECPSKRIKK
jgi:hypothetical protein